MNPNQITIKLSLLSVTLFFSFIITIAYSNAFSPTEETHNTTSSLPSQDHACLVFDPVSSSVSVGDTFTLTLQVQADSHQVDGVAAYVDFDQSRLNVEEMTLSSALPLILEESFSNNTGTINLAAGTTSNFPTGTFEFAEIELAAISQTPITSLALNFTPPRESDITFAGNSILGCHTDASIVINLPSFTPTKTPTASVTQATKTPTNTPTQPTNTPTATPTNTPTQPTSTPTAQLTASPTPSPSNQVCLVLEPEVSTVTVGEPFTVTVQVLAGTAQVDGVGAYLDFDPTQLQIQQMTDGGALPLILEEGVNNTDGTINFAAGTFSNFPTQTFDVIELVAQALTEITETELAFHFTPPRQSDITFAGQSILTCHSNGSIVALNMTPTPTNSPTVTIEPTNTATHTPIIPTQRKFFLPILLKNVE